MVSNMLCYRIYDAHEKTFGSFAGLQLRTCACGCLPDPVCRLANMSDDDESISQLSVLMGSDPGSGNEGSEPPVTPAKSKSSKSEPKSGAKPKNPKPRSKASAKKRSGRHKAGPTSKSKLKQCRACQKWLEAAMYALNQSNCIDCKKGLDVISKKCRKAGKLKWFKSVKQDPGRLKQMMTSYKAAVQEASKTGSKRAVWSLSSFVETVKASSKTRTTDEGRLMWQEEALLFWQSVQGGCLSKSASQSLWDSMKETAEEDGTITDMGGPKQAPFRMRVKTGDLVNFEGTYGRSKHFGSQLDVCWMFILCCKLSVADGSRRVLHVKLHFAVDLQRNPPSLPPSPSPPRNEAHQRSRAVEFGLKPCRHAQTPHRPRAPPNISIL